PRLLQLWAVGLVAACIVSGASAMGYLESLQARALDLLIYLQSPRQPSGLVIVAIDDAAFDALGRRQPLPRDYLARVLRGVTRAGATVIGLDISLRTASAPADDRAMAEAIADLGAHADRRLVVAGPALPATGPLSDPAIRRLVTTSAPDVPVDDDGVVRRARPGGGAGAASRPSRPRWPVCRHRTWELSTASTLSAPREVSSPFLRMRWPPSATPASTLPATTRCAGAPCSSAAASPTDAISIARPTGSCP